jgi:hypothetical protein
LIRELKNKTCKVCKVVFKPKFSSLEMVCSSKCAHEYKNRTPKKHNTIRKVGAKMEIYLKEYKAVRTDFLKTYPLCKANLKDCTNLSIDVHHTKKMGKYLNDVSTFMAVCRNCHTWIHNNPNEAKIKGYLQ